MWTTILTALTGPLSTYLTRRSEIKAQQHENDLASLKAQGDRAAALISSGLSADAAWEMEFARQAGSSWKDEFELVVLSAPLVLCFLPFGPPIVKRGFDAIAVTPGWFQFLVVSIYLANYGIRYWRKTQSDT